MKKRLRYKTALLASKDSSVRPEDAYHICGTRMLECTACKSVFCPECDQWFGKMQACCKNAVDAYVDDSMEKHMKLRAVRKATEERIKKRRLKFKSKVKIEEIGVGL